MDFDILREKIKTAQLGYSFSTEICRQLMDMFSEDVREQCSKCSTSCMYLSTNKCPINCMLFSSMR